jgi:hypothetical protein
MSTMHAPLATGTGGMARGGGEVIDIGGQQPHTPFCSLSHVCSAAWYHCSDGRSDRVHETDDVARPAGD